MTFDFHVQIPPGTKFGIICIFTLRFSLSPSISQIGIAQRMDILLITTHSNQVTLLLKSINILVGP